MHVVFLVWLGCNALTIANLFSRMHTQTPPGDGENQMEEAFDQEGHSKNYKILTYPGPVTFQQFRS